MDWDVITFRDSFDFLRTANNSRAELSDTGPVGYLHYGDIHTKWRTILKCDQEVFPKITKRVAVGVPILQNGDLVMADASEDYEGVGVSVEISNIGNQQIVSGLHTILLRDKGNKFADGFRGYIQYIPAVRRRMIQVATGVSVYSISKGQLLDVAIPRPPLKEQKKIHKILSSVDEAINKTKRTIVQTQTLKKSLMQTLFARGLPGKHNKFKKTKIGLIPIEWGISSIGRECRVQTGATPLRSNGSYHLNGTVPWVKTTDLNNSEIEKTEESITEDAITNTNCKKIQKGALLVAMYGGFNQIGRTGVLRIEAATNQALAAILPSQNIVVEFLNFFLITQRERWKSIAGSSRKDPNITKKDVERFLIPIVPVDEQNKIVNTFMLIESNLKSMRLLLERYVELKTALMQVLLTGKMRVNL